MRVHMDCAGCESKVKSALQKVKGWYHKLSTPINVIVFLYDFSLVCKNFSIYNIRDFHVHTQVLTKLTLISVCKRWRSPDGLTRKRFLKQSGKPAGELSCGSCPTIQNTTVLLITTTINTNAMAPWHIMHPSLRLLTITISMDMIAMILPIIITPLIQLYLVTKMVQLLVMRILMLVL